MIKAVGMILNRRNEEAVDCARKASLFFQQNGTDAFDMQRETSAKDPDLIITFDGDGTGKPTDGSLPEPTEKD